MQAPTAWLWDFGDDSLSTDQNPSHDYENHGYYTVRLRVTGAEGVSVMEKENYIYVDFPIGVENAPQHNVLHPNYPNPFNPTTLIRFDTVQRAHVSLVVYNVRGQRVRTLWNEETPAGYHQVRWGGRNDNGSSVSTGIYFYQLRISGSGPSFRSTRKMLLVK